MIEDPAEALGILLEELKRQKAAGLRRVSVSDEAVATLKALAGAPVAAPSPIAATASSVRSTPLAVTPKPAAVATTPVIADAPIFTLPAGTKAERMQALGLATPFHEALAQAVVRTLMAPDRYGGKFRLQVLVCDFDGLKMAEAASSIPETT